MLPAEIDYRETSAAAITLLVAERRTNAAMREQLDDCMRLIGRIWDGDRETLLANSSIALMDDDGAMLLASDYKEQRDALRAEMNFIDAVAGRALESRAHLLIDEVMRLRAAIEQILRIIHGRDGSL